MNPLNVLRAQEVMVPFASLPRSRGNGAARIDEELTLTASGEGRRDGEAVPVVALEDVDRAPHRAFITVGRDTPLRALIDARLKHTGPFIIRENGRDRRPDPRRGPLPLPDQRARRWRAGNGRTVLKTALIGAPCRARLLDNPGPALPMCGPSIPARDALAGISS